MHIKLSFKGQNKQLDGNVTWCTKISGMKVELKNTYQGAKNGRSKKNIAIKCITVILKT